MAMPFGSKIPELWPLSLLWEKKSKWENKQWNNLKYLVSSPSLLKESWRWLKQACVKWRMGHCSESRSVGCAKEFNDEDKSWGFSCSAYWKHTEMLFSYCLGEGFSLKDLLSRKNFLSYTGRGKLWVAHLGESKARLKFLCSNRSSKFSLFVVSTSINKEIHSQSTVNMIIT